MPSHFKGSKRDTAALNAYINLMRASDSLAGRLTAQLESHELTMGQFGVLEALYHLGPMCQGMLGKKLLRSGGNITVVVDNLEKHGLVLRERQKDDRRKVLIRLTQPGKAILEQMLPAHVEAIVKEMSQLTPEEQEELRRICRKLGKGGEELCQERLAKETQDAANPTE
ncbi:MAG TPA: MarR family transcriptional regulator [Candidatus Acidoferrales bacterium]|nr:MarR family transcriptional regulator [Candidatus Acidoferrales bacterium]